MSEPEKHLRTPRKLSQIAVQSTQGSPRNVEQKKLETRNPKQIQMIKNTKFKTILFRILSFGFRILIDRVQLLRR